MFIFLCTEVQHIIKYFSQDSAGRRTKTKDSWFWRISKTRKMARWFWFTRRQWHVRSSRARQSRGKTNDKFPSGAEKNGTEWNKNDKNTNGAENEKTTETIDHISWHWKGERIFLSKNPLIKSFEAKFEMLKLYMLISLNLVIGWSCQWSAWRLECTHYTYQSSKTEWKREQNSAR